MKKDPLLTKGKLDNQYYLVENMLHFFFPAEETFMRGKNQQIGMALRKSLIWNWQSYLHSAAELARL